MQRLLRVGQGGKGRGKRHAQLARAGERFSMLFLFDFSSAARGLGIQAVRKLEQGCREIAHTRNSCTSRPQNRQLATCLPKMVRPNEFRKRTRFPDPSPFAHLPIRVQNWGEYRGCAALDLNGCPRSFSSVQGAVPAPEYLHGAQVLGRVRGDSSTHIVIGLLPLRPSAVSALAGTWHVARLPTHLLSQRWETVFRRRLPLLDAAGWRAGRRHFWPHDARGRELSRR